MTALVQQYLKTKIRHLSKAQEMVIYSESYKSNKYIRKVVFRNVKHWLTATVKLDF